MPKCQEDMTEKELVRTGSPSSLLFSSLLCKLLTKRSKHKIILKPSMVVKALLKSATLDRGTVPVLCGQDIR